MTLQNADDVAVESEADREITARFSQGELVRGWSEREPRTPAYVTVVRVAAKTDLGRVRENNEDKFDMYEPEDPTLLATRGSFYAVADGMGGHAAGQIASEIALKTVISRYYDNATLDAPDALTDAVVIANDTIHNIAVMIPERSGMGTTLSAAVVIENRVLVAQVGDSRGYLVRGDSVRQVTEDHSWVAEQVRRGGMTEEEAESSPYRNVITRSLGPNPSVEPDIFTEEARVGDVWVLCSDGLTGHVHGDEIRLIASTQSPSEAARQLIELANARGGRDNVTVLVFSIRDLVAPPAADPSAPADPEENSTDAPAKKKGIGRLFGR